MVTVSFREAENPEADIFTKFKNNLTFNEQSWRTLLKNLTAIDRDVETLSTKLDEPFLS
jgi:hypothetical protein